MTYTITFDSIAGVMGNPLSNNPEFKALKESVNELKQLMKEYCIRCLGELCEDDIELKQSITKYLEDQGATPKTDTPTSSKIQQAE